MTRIHHILLSTITAVILLGAGASARAEVHLGEVAPDFSLPDQNGEWHQLTDHVGTVVMLEWVDFSCPFAQKFYDSGAMQELQKTYIKQGVTWLTILSATPDSPGHLSPEDAVKLLKEKRSAASAFLLDENGEVAKQYGARMTPQFFVIGMDGRLGYIGAADDRPTTDKADAKKAHSFITAALDALLAGQNVTMSYVNPYGCPIAKPAKKGEASIQEEPEIPPTETQDSAETQEERRSPAQNSFPSDEK